MKDLTEKYFHGCSPYIQSLSYDLDRRELSLICFKSVDDQTPGKQLLFAEVNEFDEIQFEDAGDKDLIDSIMGIHLSSNSVYCINTEKRELVLRVGVEPRSIEIGGA